jgi:YVTN family beta-propeller protein
MSMPTFDFLASMTVNRAVSMRDTARCRVKLAASFAAAAWALAGSLALSGSAAAGSYQIYVSDERSNEVTVIDGGDFSVVGTIPVGKRPRGIHASPDGKSVYVALSGTPIAIPPQLDAHGNPIFKRDDDTGTGSDKAADGIGIIDVAQKRLTSKIFAGSDPEEFALSRDGTQIYVSNEDTKSASVVNIAAAKVEHVIPVGQEPEGVATTPDGKQFYVTCETSGDVYVVDTSSYSVVGHFKVDPRPRTVAFLPSAGVAFVPSAHRIPTDGRAGVGRWPFGLREQRARRHGIDRRLA